MADPFSITAGIVGIGLAGVKLSRNIYEVVDTFGSARGDVEAIGRELACFVVVVDDLASDFKARRSTYSNKLLQSLRDIIAQCRLRFKEINNLICSVKFHSRGSRFRSSCLWIFREKSVNKIRASLDSLKLTLTVILQTVRLARKKRRRRKHGDKEDRTLLESLIEAQVRSVIHLQKVGQSNHQVPSIPFATQANTGRLSASSNNFAQHPKQTDVTQETASLLLALVPYNSVANGRSPSPPLPSPALAVTSNTIVTGDPSPSDPPRDAHVALPVRRPPTSDGVNTVPAQRSWINHGGNTVDQLLLTWTNNAGPQIANNTTGKFSTDEASSSDDEVQAVDDLDWLEPLIMSEQQMQFEQNITQDDGLVDEDGRPKPPTFAHDSDTYKTPLVTEPNGQTVSFNKHIRKAWIEKPPPLGSEDHVSATLFRILCQNGHAVMYKKVYRDRHEFFLESTDGNILIYGDPEAPYKRQSGRSYVSQTYDRSRWMA
ncbi:MAG: hypothetical protein M1833_004151 [Piccolia ochrophora]|nr:MAG: hypothetical protein M1833_004151 [Piccolia ochrophora]